MTRDNTATTAEQILRDAGDETPATRNEQTPDEETDATEGHEVSLNGETVDIGRDTTVGELRETAEIGTDEVFTHRSPDGIEALTDDDVIADHVADGGEIQTQPIADSEVFGAR